MRNKQEKKEMGYLQARNAESKSKYAIRKCGTLKTKYNDRFAGAEQGRVKGNRLSASAER